MISSREAMTAISAMLAVKDQSTESIAFLIHMRMKEKHETFESVNIAAIIRETVTKTGVTCILCHVSFFV